MAILRVDPHGLNALAVSCAENATTVRSALAADGHSGPDCQATSAAVTMSDSMVDAACRTLAERVGDLSSRLSVAASAYRGRDQDSAATLGRAVDGMSP